MLGGCAALHASPAGDPRLNSLDVQATAGGIGSLSPAFSETAFDYTLQVQSDINEVAVVLGTRHGSAFNMNLNGDSVTSGVPHVVKLAVGDNPVRVEVKDRTNMRAVYTVTITREDIRPVVDSFKKMTFHDPATGVTMGYRLFVPEGYDSTRSYPLVLFLHGAGESGSDNEHQLTANQGATIWAKPREQARHPCFVLAPQNPKDPEATSPEDFGRRGWTTLLRRGFADPFKSEPALETAFRVLQQVMADYRIDRKRVYATGLSMGCFGVFAMNVDHPDAFAAVVGICGGLDPAKAAALADKPVWVFHAAQDPIVDVRFSRETVKALREAGGKPRYTEYGREVYFAPAAHWSWVPAYASSEMKDWLFAQSRFDVSMRSRGQRPGHRRVGRGGLVRRPRLSFTARAPSVDVIGIGEGFASALARPHANDVLDRIDEDDPITLLPRARCLHDRLHRPFDIALAENDVELDFRQHVLVQVGVSPGMLLAAQAPVAPDLKDVHADDPDLRKGLAYRVQRLFPDNGLDLAKHHALLFWPRLFASDDHAPYAIRLERVHGSFP